MQVVTLLKNNSAMKMNKIIFALVIISCLTSFTYTHPLKLTTSLIEYKSKKNSLQMECRVFMDDFLMSLGKSINLSDPTKDERKLIQDHFAKNYVIMLNDQIYPFQLNYWEAMEAQNVFIMKFNIDAFSIKKGDQLCIKNQLFFKEFDFLQSNKVTLKIPPIIDQLYFETVSSRREVTLNL